MIFGPISFSQNKNLCPAISRQPIFTYQSYFACRTKNSERTTNINSKLHTSFINYLHMRANLPASKKKIILRDLRPSFCGNGTKNARTILPGYLKKSLFKNIVPKKSYHWVENCGRSWFWGVSDINWFSRMSKDKSNGL